MDDASVVNKAGFAEMGERFERTLTTSNKNLGQKLDQLTDLLRQLLEKQGEKRQLQPAAAVPAQSVSVKPEPADQSDEMKSYAFRHSTPQVSPQHSPVKTEVKVAQQSVEHSLELCAGRKF